MHFQGAVIDLWSHCQDDPHFKQESPPEKEGKGAKRGAAKKSEATLKAEQRDLQNNRKRQCM